MAGNSTRLAPREAGIVRDLWIANLTVFSVVSLGAFFVAPLLSAISVVVGGVVAVINFRLLEKTLCKAFLPRDTKGAMGVVLFKYYLRFIATALSLWILVSQELVEPLGLLVGLSVVVVSVIIFGAVKARRLYKEAY